MQRRPNYRRVSSETLVEARCNWCGRVRIPHQTLTVHALPEGGGMVEFSCPECLRMMGRTLRPGEVGALIAAGIAPSLGPAPWEAFEDHEGPPITWDDLIDFHEFLWGKAGASGAGAHHCNRNSDPEVERKAA